MKHLLLFFALASVLFSSCQSENNVKPVEPRSGDNFKFFESDGLFENALARRSATYSAPFEILSVETIRHHMATGHDFLVVTVEHKNDCSGDFELIWDGAIMESYPLRVNIALRYNAGCDGFAERTKTVLSVDLDEFIGDTDLVDNAVFHIVNTSRIMSDADVVVHPNSSN